MKTTHVFFVTSYLSVVHHVQYQSSNIGTRSVAVLEYLNTLYSFLSSEIRQLNSRGKSNLQGAICGGWGHRKLSLRWWIWEDMGNTK
jgi:hypothetical protein